MISKRFLALAVVIAVLVSFTAAVEGASATKVALVTLSVNDYGSMLEGGSSSNAAALVEQNMRKLVDLTEQSLAERWTVVGVASFITNEAYRGLSIGKIKDGLFGAEYDGLVLPSFTADRKEIIKCVLEKGTAKRLCEILGVDAVVVVYSEWAVATGRWAPTNKALTKNCVAIYDSSGKKLFFDRRDIMGKKTLGAMGDFVLDENTISEWVNSYKEGFDAVLAKNAKKLK